MGEERVVVNKVNPVSLVVKIQKLKTATDAGLHPAIDEILGAVRLLVSEKKKREQQLSRIAHLMAELGWLRELEEVDDGRSNS